MLDRGADAYSERMDCFRSGREGTFEEGLVAAALDGLPGALDDADPKKSKPRRESPVLFCF